jgi:1,4-alpha-glucan branching enzyme
MAGDEWRQFAGLRGLLAYQWAHPGKQLLFMGSEFGQEAEWSEQTGLDWQALGDSIQPQGFHGGVQRLVRDLNQVYREQSALWRQDFSPDGFGWIDASDSGGNVLSFLRFPGQGGTGPGARFIACVANFSGGPHDDYRIGLPTAGRWREVINTDAADYGGSGVGNLGAIEAVAAPRHGQPASATVTLPPLGVLWLVPDD